MQNISPTGGSEPTVQKRGHGWMVAHTGGDSHCGGTRLSSLPLGTTLQLQGCALAGYEVSPRTFLRIKLQKKE